MAAFRNTHAFLRPDGSVPWQNVRRDPVAPIAPDPAAEAQAREQRAAEAAQLEKLRVAGRGGRRQTLLTGPTGLTDPVPTRRKTLLGD